MNPMYWLDLRIRAREKRLWIIALFIIATLLIVSGVVLASVFLSGEWRMVQPSDVGSGIAWAALYCEAGILVLLAPLATAGRISQEREQRTMPALINSPLPTWAIARGKLLGSWTFVFWLSVLVIPFLATASLWGGPDIRLIVVCFSFNLLAGLVLSTLSLGLSGLFGRSLTAYLVTGAFLFGWLAVMPLIGALAMALNPEGGRTYQEFVAYATLYHHPFFPMITLGATPWRVDFVRSMLHLLYCVAVWLGIGALGFGLSARSLKKEVF